MGRPLTRRDWTKREELELVKDYPEMLWEDLCRKYGRTHVSIKVKALKMRLHRTENPSNVKRYQSYTLRLKDGSGNIIRERTIIGGQYAPKRKREVIKEWIRIHEAEFSQGWHLDITHNLEHIKLPDNA